MHLRVASLNVWALPWPAGTEVARRIAAVGERLPELGADAVVLQEVWREDARSALIEAGRRAGLPHHWHRPVARSGGGLLVLSRLPVASARFERYRQRGLPQHPWHGDYFGGKGFAELRLQTPAGPIALIDTHLHAQYGDDTHDEYLAQRTGQAVQLAARIREIREPLVAAGDFNIREGRPEYRVLTGLTGLRDVAAELDRRQPTVLAENSLRTGPGAREQRIDYVFVLDGHERAVRTRGIRRIFDGPLRLDGRSTALSDHAGILAELEIGGGPPDRPSEPHPEAIELARRILEAGREAARHRRRLERVAAGVAFGASTLALTAARRPGLARRRLLRLALYGSSLLALPPALAAAALSELFGPEALRALDADLAQLERMRVASTRRGLREASAIESGAPDTR